MRRYRLTILIIVAALALGGVQGAAGGSIAYGAAASEAVKCELAMLDAARKAGVPPRLMLALGPTESGIGNGRGGRWPWPWTLNAKGHGSYHFRTRAAAERHLRRLLAAGIDNVDIGCMQINWHWHHQAFRSPAAALEPGANALYAAQLLQKYKAKTGSWAGAVGLYHSRDPQRAALYRCRVARVLAPHEPLAGCS